jgi:hypothetical protein
VDIITNCLQEADISANIVTDQDDVALRLLFMA